MGIIISVVRENRRGGRSFKRGEVRSRFIDRGCYLDG